MWKLTSIKATNLCAFENLEYEFLQNQATLVFGNNMDDDSQNSNGSGKSALIEAIAISITGETLRKVNMDEIINDAHDQATLEASLYNTDDQVLMTISRTLTRKKPQTVSVVLNHTTGRNEGEVEEVKQSSVADYNAYILESIGLTKDDIFSNFILTAKKYKSFLSSSDREKKEIINRFSNGILVDESIEALHNDMEPVQDSLLAAEKKVAECTGRVSALDVEIERAIEDSKSRSENKKERIENWKNAIVEKRAKIREINAEIDNISDVLTQIDDLDAKMCDLEDGDEGFQNLYGIIKEEFAKVGLDPISDYIDTFKKLGKECAEYKSQLVEISEQVNKATSELDCAIHKHSELVKDHHTNSEKLKSDGESMEKRIYCLGDLITALSIDVVSLNEKRANLYGLISNLKQKLAGVITCPNCKHEFMIDDDCDIEATRANLADTEEKLESVKKSIEQSENQYNSAIESKKNIQLQLDELKDAKRGIDMDLNNSKNKLEDLINNHARIEKRMAVMNDNLESVKRKIDNLRRSMFDEVFDAIDAATKRLESERESKELSVSNLDGTIKSYQESIREVENAVETDIIASLKESQSRYSRELDDAEADKNEIAEKLETLKSQETTFVEFKTHLANTKIDAISQITNGFLETIGSDIRLSLSGYTVLKSGKVRDKISISLMRDGIDCGSFDKFSRGEQTRVELACILAMHELINMNCIDGKGLNLLVIDEILDAADEQGLTNVFKAINETHITSLVVSHGNIAENYPNRLIVNKHNGVSFL